MKNAGCLMVVGMRTMEINFTLGNKIIPINVLHVSDMNMNHVSGIFLKKTNIKSVYESVKLVLTHNGVFGMKGLFH